LFYAQTLLEIDGERIMLHAPVSENKTQDKQSKTQSEPESERRALGWAGSSALGLGGENGSTAGNQRAQGWQPINLSTLSQGGILQRKCACGSSAGSSGTCGECQQEKMVLQRKVEGGNIVNEAPPIVHEVLNSPGQSLDQDARVSMESHFGEDFSQVRVHTDTKATKSAKAVNALAYTVGRNIVFGTGQYLPKTSSGQELLAHELTHVLQQRAIVNNQFETLEIGPENDPLEEDAQIHARSIAKAQQPVQKHLALSTPRLQGGFFSDIGSFFSDVFSSGPIDSIGRLFGAENYSREKLDAYLKQLTTTNQIEDRYDSDNKARAIIHHRQEFPLLSTNIKILLIREMLNGATLGDDEKAIIELLRTALPLERVEIVSKIGRENLWEDFSGTNLRTIEAITLTEKDFLDKARSEKLQNLPQDELTEYRDNAIDPAVRSNIERLLQLQRITTPLDFKTPVDASGAAHFDIGEFAVTVLPDTTTQDEKIRNQAHTSLGIDPKPSVPNATAANNIVNMMTIPGKIDITIQTTYGPGTDPSGRTGYGRGTTQDDISANKTSVRFHEGNHGLDFLEFLRTNPAPKFGGQLGMTVAQYQQAEKDYENAVNDYHQRAVYFSAKRTDCAGEKTITPEVAKQYFQDATICKKVGATP
jgi:hypothetical protein